MTPYPADAALDALMSGLGANGPWALVAGFLLWVIITEWRMDRKEVKPFFQTLGLTLNEVKNAIHANTEAQSRAAETSERILEAQERILEHLRSDSQRGGRGA